MSDSGLIIETAMHGRTDAASAPQVAISHAARLVYPDSGVGTLQQLLPELWSAPTFRSS